MTKIARIELTHVAVPLPKPFYPSWIPGYPQTEVAYDRPPRHAGSTQWTSRGLWRLALGGILSFSTIPLRIWAAVGLLVSVCSFGYGLFLILRVLLYGIDVPGYASLMVTLLMLGGMMLLSMGILGAYVGRIYNEVKNRPLYLIRARWDAADAPCSDGTEAHGP